MNAKILSVLQGYRVNLWNFGKVFSLRGSNIRVHATIPLKQVPSEETFTIQKPIW
jgi:hypothetical protein